jgi:flavin reductase (DIM6/NTAB) family NADH-FMN oxidoreductase RutF
VDAAPAVNAGNDQLITFPATTTLTATASDDGIPAGSSLTYQWTMVSGPGTVSFGDAAAPSTTATFSEPGSYVLRFAASDSLLSSSDDLVVTVNSAPTVNAGPDAQATLGVSFLLQGTVQDDGVPTNGTLTVTWTVVGGPGNATLVTPDSPITQATFDAEGTYVLRLVGSDSVATSSDDITIVVTRPNRTPIVSAGPKQLVTLPAGANLVGTVTDDGLPAGAAVTVSWSVVSGPGTVSFSNSTSNNTAALFSAAGDYVLRLTATDTEFTASSEVQVKVRTPAMNEAPVVSAGPDKVIGLTNVATLNGSFTDDGLPEGIPVTVSWSKISGPGTVTFENGSVTNARATFSSVGTYVLRLTANDSALSASDDVSVTVYPFNQPPIVDAGPDQTITIPDPSVLSASGLTPTNAGTDLTTSIFETEHWNFAIGQPGLRGNPPGSFLHVSANGIDAVSGKVLVAGSFTQAGNLPMIYWDGTTNSSAVGLAMWDGTNWHRFYDPRPIALPDPPGSTPGVHTGLQGTNIGFAVTECGGFEFCNENFNSAVFD